MHKAIFFPLTLLAFLFFNACTPQDPVACFEMSADTVEYGTIVTFNNCSENATDFEWDFGDGGSSQIANPTHRFAAERGMYQVRLRAINKDRVDEKVHNLFIGRKMYTFVKMIKFEPYGSDYNSELEFRSNSPSGGGHRQFMGYMKEYETNKDFKINVPYLGPECHIVILDDFGGERYRLTGDASLGKNGKIKVTHDQYDTEAEIRFGWEIW